MKKKNKKQNVRRAKRHIGRLFWAGWPLLARAGFCHRTARWRLFDMCECGSHVRVPWSSALPGCVCGEKMRTYYQSPSKLLQLWGRMLILSVNAGVTLRYALSDVSKFLYTKRFSTGGASRTTLFVSLSWSPDPIFFPQHSNEFHRNKNSSVLSIMSSIEIVEMIKLICLSCKINGQCFLENLFKKKRKMKKLSSSPVPIKTAPWAASGRGPPVKKRSSALCCTDSTFSHVLHLSPLSLQNKQSRWFPGPQDSGGQLLDFAQSGALASPVEQPFWGAAYQDRPHPHAGRNRSRTAPVSSCLTCTFYLPFAP